jgi:hypothetical protein
LPNIGSFDDFLRVWSPIMTPVRQLESPRRRVRISSELTVLIIWLVLACIVAGREIQQIGDGLFGGIAQAVMQAGADADPALSHPTP